MRVTLNKLIINLGQIATNARAAKALAHASGYQFVAVLKAVHCHPKLIETLTAAGADSFAFSSIASVAASASSDLPERARRLLLGPSAPATAALAVTYFGTSIQSTVESIEALGRAAVAGSLSHGVYLALRTEDDREGINIGDWETILSLARAIVANGLKLEGLACNLGCTQLDPITATRVDQILALRTKLAGELQQDIGLSLGGSFLLPDLQALGGDLSLRVGELLLSGTEPAGRSIETCATGFRIEASIVEVSTDPSRVLVDVGSAALEKGAYKICLPDAQTISMSGEFMVISARFLNKPEVGDLISFELGYNSLKKALTFPFLDWQWIETSPASPI